MILRCDLMKKTIYIYRGSLTGGGCFKIVRDLIMLLHREGRFNIVVISYVSTKLNLNVDDDGNIIPLTHIMLSENNHWRPQLVEQLKNHVDMQTNPTLISLLDSNSNRFFAICGALLRNNMHWINFDTNHPSVIQSWFKTKNYGVGITFSDLCESVDVIRLENENFDKYIPENSRNKIISFYNTVTLPEFQKKKFSSKYNLINVNGLREPRKSIIPFVTHMNELVDAKFDFKLHILGDESSKLRTELDSVLANNPKISEYIEIHGLVDNIHDYYASGDLMVTTATYEGTSNAVIESFSHSVPVLCLNYSLGLSETIEGGVTGLLCKSPSDMVTKVSSLLANPPQLSELKAGCKELHPKLLDEKLGIGKYLELIDGAKFTHSEHHRKKLVDYSFVYLAKPGIYRQSLDALVIYIETDNLNAGRMEKIFETESFAEATHCLFIVKHTGKDSLNKFQKDVVDLHGKCRVVFDYETLPEQVMNYIHTNTAADGLALLSFNADLHTWLRENFINVVAYFDATYDNVWWLKKYKVFLKELTKYQYMDSWIWLVGSDDVAPNNCILSLEPWFMFKFDEFVKNNNTVWYVSKNKMKERINLPKEIMRSVRRLY